jgi:DNA-binding MltR family transcriptional regulator
MAKASTDSPTNISELEEAHQWTSTFLRDQFQKESDRAAVILTASLLDETLGTLIRTFLIPCSTPKDLLFEDATSPLSTFSAKIDMAHRLGLISSKLTRDIHLIRKIRNSFAHDIFGCDFANGSVRSRVLELKKSIVIVDHFSKQPDVADHLKGTRGEFLYCSYFILTYLNDLIQLNNHLSEKSSEPFLYTVMTGKGKTIQEK